MPQLNFYSTKPSATKLQLLYLRLKPNQSYLCSEYSCPFGGPILILSKTYNYESVFRVYTMLSEEGQLIVQFYPYQPRNTIGHNLFYYI